MMGLDIEWRDFEGALVGRCLDRSSILADAIGEGQSRQGEFPISQRIDLYRDTDLPLRSGVLQEIVRLRDEEQDPGRRAYLSKVVAFLRDAESFYSGSLRFIGD